MKALKVLASLALAATAFGQMRDNQDKQMTCDSSGYGSRARYCEVREQITAAMGLLNVDPGQNGGATVKGWSRNEVLVRSRVEGWADSDANARITASPGLRQHLGRTCSGTRSAVFKQCGVVRELRNLRAAGNQSDGEDRQRGHYCVGHSRESAIRGNQRGGQPQAPGGRCSRFHGKRRHQSRADGNDMGWQSGPGDDAEWRRECLRSGELFSAFSDRDSQRSSTLRISAQPAGRPSLRQSGLQHWRGRTSDPRDDNEWSRETEEGLRSREVPLLALRPRLRLRLINAVVHGVMWSSQIAPVQLTARDRHTGALATRHAADRILREPRELADPASPAEYPDMAREGVNGIHPVSASSRSAFPVAWQPVSKHDGSIEREPRLRVHDRVFRLFGVRELSGLRSRIICRYASHQRFCNWKQIENGLRPAHESGGHHKIWPSGRRPGQGSRKTHSQGQRSPGARSCVNSFCRGLEDKKG